MQNFSAIPARGMLRNYKKVFDKVKRTGEPVVVMRQKRPQVAIVSLNDLERLRQLKYKNSTKVLLNIAKEVRNILKDEVLPTDLSSKHDYYLWENNKK